MERKSQIIRKTNETDIVLSLGLDKSGGSLDTGIPFFDHMLNSFRVHSNLYLDVKAKGDIEIDCHHTIEDVGIALGCAIKEALGDKKGIERFASIYLPLDEALVRCALDVSGRPHLTFQSPLIYGSVGDFDVQMTKEFFYAVAMNAGLTLHISVLYGENYHHIIEAVFKSFARALKNAVKITGTEIPSSKGWL